MKNNKEFSKSLLAQESSLIWIITISGLFLAFFCVLKGYIGSLPWIATLISVAWGAYGVSQAFYYNKAKAENTQGGIKYETVIKELEYSQ